MLGNSRPNTPMGVVCAVMVALIGCGDGGSGYAHHVEVADAIAETARATEMDRLEEIDARQDALGDDVHYDLRTVMDDLEPPGGVAEVRVSYGRSATSWTEAFVQVARSMAVVPDDGDPFCVVVGLSSDGTVAGSPAQGDVDDDCADAVIPSQAESAADGNPLDLWDQTDHPV